MAASAAQSRMRVLGIDHSLVRHRVVAALVEGMTTQHASQAKPGPAQGAVTLDGGVCVAGAAGIEAATSPKPRGEQQLVTADDPQEELAQGRHCCVIEFQCLSRLARKSLGVACRAASRAETVTSTGGNECWFKRKDSRVRRLMRLRATAVPKVRVAMLNPNRG